MVIKTKSVRVCIAAFVALCLLFAQMAVAAYACPQLTQKQAGSARVVMAAMADCDALPLGQMDNQQPNLCKAYCQAEQQSHDAKNSVSVTPVALDIFWSPAWVLTPSLEFVGRDFSLSQDFSRLRGSVSIYLVNQVFRL